MEIPDLKVNNLQKQTVENEQWIWILTMSKTSSKRNGIQYSIKKDNHKLAKDETEVYFQIALWVDGKRHGMALDILKNGDYKFETYDKYSLHGAVVHYYSSGAIKREGQETNDEMDGKWTHYYENGDILSN